MQYIGMLGQVRIAAVLRVEFRGALERVRLLAKFLAHLRRAGGSGPVGGMPSKSPLQVTDRSPRMLIMPSARTWPAFGMPDRHAVLLLHGRIGRGRFHASELDRRRLSRIARWQARRRAHGRLVFAVVRQILRRHVLGDELIAGPVVRPGAIDVRLDERPARHLPFPDGAVHIGDRGFHQMKLERLRLPLLPGRAVRADGQHAQQQDAERCVGETHKSSAMRGLWIRTL